MNILSLLEELKDCCWHMLIFLGIVNLGLVVIALDCHPKLCLWKIYLILTFSCYWGWSLTRIFYNQDCCWHLVVFSGIVKLRLLVIAFSFQFQLDNNCKPQIITKYPDCLETTGNLIGSLDTCSIKYSASEWQEEPLKT